MDFLVSVKNRIEELVPNIGDISSARVPKPNTQNSYTKSGPSRTSGTPKSVPKSRFSFTRSFFSESYSQLKDIEVNAEDKQLVSNYENNLRNNEKDIEI